MPENNMRVAIVCDWLLGTGGAERVVLELHRMFPDAPIYTSQYDSSKIEWFKEADVRTTWLQKLPRGLKKFLPVLRAWAFSHLYLSEYDVVISATGAESKAVRSSKDTVHICYCFAPTHYYWSRYEQYMKSPGFGAFDWLARIGLGVLVGPMRRWDERAAQHPDFFISISTHIQKEIKKYYGRESVIIHPPVDTARFQAKSNEHGFVVVGRQTPYKRIDLAVSACSKLNLPLTVIGDGPEQDRLRKLAGPTIQFLTNASDQDVTKYIQEATAFVFPGLDDFGIVAVEAMAAGIPVIAYQAGGALDYVIPGKTGEFFTKPTVDALVDILKKFDPSKYSASGIQKHAAQFDVNSFHKNIKEYVARVVAKESNK